MVCSSTHREFQVLINDRLLVPNTIETFVALEPELRTFFDKLYGGTEYEISYKTDPRERFTVEIKAVTRFDVETLLNIVSLELSLSCEELASDEAIHKETASQQSVAHMCLHRRRRTG